MTGTIFPTSPILTHSSTRALFLVSERFSKLNDGLQATRALFLVSERLSKLNCLLPKRTWSLVCLFRMLQRRLVRFYRWSEEDVNDEGTGQENEVGDGVPSHELVHVAAAAS